MSDEANRTTYGKCNNPHGHGHNYYVEITVGGPVSAETGFVVGMLKLDALAQREVIDRFDHVHLNTDEAFCGEWVPSTENLTIEIERIFREAVPKLDDDGQLQLIAVRVEETKNNAFDLPAGEAQTVLPPRTLL